MSVFEKNKIEEIKKDSQIIKHEINRQFFTFITAGFGFVVGLAWNDAIEKSIEYFFPINKDNLWAKFVYAIVLTLILTLVSIYLARAFGKKNKN